MRAPSERQFSSSGPTRSDDTTFLSIVERRRWLRPGSRDRRSYTVKTRSRPSRPRPGSLLFMTLTRQPVAKRTGARPVVRV